MADTKYTVTQEIVHAVSHGIGSVLIIAGLVVLLVPDPPMKHSEVNSWGGICPSLILSRTCDIAIPQDCTWYSLGFGKYKFIIADIRINSGGRG